MCVCVCLVSGHMAHIDGAFHNWIIERQIRFYSQWRHAMMLNSDLCRYIYLPLSLSPSLIDHSPMMYMHTHSHTLTHLPIDASYTYCLHWLIERHSLLIFYGSSPGVASHAYLLSPLPSFWSFQSSQSQSRFLLAPFSAVFSKSVYIC